MIFNVLSDYKLNAQYANDTDKSRLINIVEIGIGKCNQT